MILIFYNHFYNQFYNFYAFFHVNRKNFYIKNKYATASLLHINRENHIKSFLESHSIILFNFINIFICVISLNLCCLEKISISRSVILIKRGQSQAILSPTVLWAPLMCSRTDFNCVCNVINRIMLRFICLSYISINFIYQSVK